MNCYLAQSADLRFTNIKDYYASYNIYSFGAGLVSVFISLFFFSQYNYSAVLYFYLITYLTEIAAYVAASYLLRRYYPEHLYAFGVILSIFILLGMLLFNGTFANILVFGLIWGTSIGVFWSGANVIIYDITIHSNRMLFVSINSVINGVVSLIAPAIAGFLIQSSTLPGVLRFLWDFTGACIFFIISIFLILAIREKNEKRFDFSIRKAIIKTRKGYGKFKLYFVASTAFSLPFGIIPAIYVFQVTGSYFITGLFASYQMLIYIFMNFVTRKGILSNGPFIKIAIPGIIVSSLLLIPNVLVAPINVFLWAGLYTLFSTPLNNVVSVEFMKFIGRNMDIDRSLFWANREFYLAIGRAAVMVFLIVFVSALLKNTLTFVLVFPILSLYALTYINIVKDQET